MTQRYDVAIEYAPDDAKQPTYSGVLITFKTTGLGGETYVSSQPITPPCASHADAARCINAAIKKAQKATTPSEQQCILRGIKPFPTAVANQLFATRLTRN